MIMLRRVMVGLATVAVAFGVVTIAAAPAAACTCAGLDDAGHTAHSDVVFVGRVAETQIGSASATFEVNEVFKGEVRKDARVTNRVSDCSSPFVADEVLLVFADYANDRAQEPNDRLSAPACSGTRPVTLGAVTLSGGHLPLAADGSPQDGGFPLLGWLSFLAVAGLGAMAGGLWFKLRSKLDQP